VGAPQTGLHDTHARTRTPLCTHALRLPVPLPTPIMPDMPTANDRVPAALCVAAKWTPRRHHCHNTGLARSVELEWTHVNLCDVEAAIAAALQRAAEPDDGDAAAPGPGSCRAGPLLCTCVKANVMGPLLLAHLPASSLTCLELGHVVDYARASRAGRHLWQLCPGRLVCCIACMCRHACRPHADTRVRLRVHCCVCCRGRSCGRGARKADR
jgi:hypothetical protein